MKKILLICLMICGYLLNAQVCFKAPQVFTPSGPSAKTIRSADFDNNGIPDFITVNCSTVVSAGITVMMNYNAATTNFASNLTYSLTFSNTPTDIAVADFDGNGYQDIVVVNNGSSNVSVMQGAGNGTFGTPINFSVGSAPKSVTVADFNNDGKLDMAVVNNAGNSISILTNTSSGIGVFTFSNTSTLTGLSNPLTITSGDLNQDNKPDLAILSTSGSNVSVFLNTGGTFSGLTNYVSASTPGSITLGDFDGVNGLDIATVSSSSASLSVLLNTGTGTFGAVNNYSSSTNYLEGVTNGDFDQDGKLDVAAIGYGTSSGIFIFRGNGNGTFATGVQTVTTTTGSGNIPLINGNYNSDAIPDLAFLLPGSNSVNISLNAKPIITGVTTICAGAATTLTASGASTTYSWSANAGSATTNTVSLSPSTTTVYTVTGTVGSCSSTATSTINVNALPVITTTASPATICVGASSTLTAAGAVTYTWSPSTNLSTTLGAVVVASPTTSIVYTAIGTGANGCVSDPYYGGNTNVGVNNVPVLTVTSTSATTCYGVCNGQGVVNVTGVGGPLSVTPANWSLAGYTANGANLCAGTQSLTVTGGNGCSSTQTLVITSPPAILVPITPSNTSICSGSSVAFTANVSGGTAPYAYNWNPSSGLSSSTVSNPVATPVATTIYTLTVSDASGCTQIATSTITVMPLPTINISPSSAAICIGNSATLTASGASTYVWNPGSISGSTVSVSPGSTTDYTVTGTNVNGCVNTASLTITANPKPPAFSSVNTPVCVGQPLTFTTNLVSGGTYAWMEPDGSTSNLQNPNISSAALTNAGTYSLTITSSAGCTNTATVSAVVNALPSLTVNSATICAGATCTLTVTGATTYTWSPSSSLSSVNSPTVVAFPTGTTNYLINGTDANGCMNMVSSNVVVNQLPVVTVTSPTICYASTGTISATVSGGTPAYTYLWSNGATGSNITVTPTVSTQYNLTATDAAGCTGTGVSSVVVVSNDDLSGTIYDTTSSGPHPIAHGLVYLYQQQGTSLAIDTTGLLANGTSAAIQSNGSYSFSQVVGGNYFLKAVADTNFYQGSVATYFSTRLNKAFRWDSATPVIHAGCGNGTDGGHNINIIELPAMNGNGVISGTITTAAGFGGRYAAGGYHPVMGSPLKGIDVKLGKNPGGCAARTTADTSGAYTFTGIDPGSYSIYVDIPNYGMVTILTTTITAANPQSTNNNYCVDSVAINVCTLTAIQQTTGNNYQVNVYPNPNTGLFNLQVSEHENMTVEIYSVIGQKVWSETLQNNTQLLNISSLNEGIYLIRVLKNNSVVYQTKVTKL